MQAVVAVVEVIKAVPMEQLPIPIPVPKPVATATIAITKVMATYNRKSKPFHPSYYPT